MQASFFGDKKVGPLESGFVDKKVSEFIPFLKGFRFRILRPFALSDLLELPGANQTTGLFLLLLLLLRAGFSKFWTCAVRKT